MSVGFDSLNNASSHSFGAHQHGVASTLQQRRIDKSRSNVGERDSQLPSVGKLLQSLDIIVLESLCSAIRW